MHIVKDKNGDVASSPPGGSVTHVNPVSVGPMAGVADDKLAVAHDLARDKAETITDDATDSPADRGEKSISGSAPAVTSDDNTKEAVANVIGNKPKNGKPFSIADEVEKDEKARRGIS